MPRKRLDLLLVERGLFSSRSAAQREILAGNVFVNHQLADKPGALVAVDASIEIKRRSPYVSQGGLKLEKALREFQIDITDKVCIDIGASTGGFTDCLLQHGAEKVYAVDVGKGQLDWKLRNDPRVVVLEGVNARYLKPEQIGERVDLATVDVSFISLKLILLPLKAIVKGGGDILALVKPQFEAGKGKVKRGGVVEDKKVHLEVLQGLAHFTVEELNLSVLNATFSPIKGPAGNIEFLLHIKNASGASLELDFESLVRQAHDAFTRWHVFK